MILHHFNLQNANASGSPMVPGATFNKSDSPSDASEASFMAYQEAIGSLMYAAIATHPDIAFAVSYLSQFLENPGHTHWDATK